ncbi:FAD:protein FMN transferase [Marinigracilibium pacificum]|uniref:FAD:protein FMN transferase n=1 Tax=Marinigracilibium pacificum TaxID=2729599 RepID=A0A848ITI5_9BACT|nr:FAD:protein FMN transferase [Marinigracilibium pacificum]NMM47657.1 FAD:protein FMN transferase [Marinigracilibium pacificum]
MKEYSIRKKLMGTAFELTVVESSEKRANKYLLEGIEEILRIEKLLSEYNEDSETARINNHDYESPLVIDEECYNLIERSLAISLLTKGSFDITVSPLKDLYSFNNGEVAFPSNRSITQALSSVGYKKIKLNDGAINLSTENMKISFNAIGKGYASDMVKKLWLKNGVKAGYINASGDLSCFGNRADNSDWRIGIANPDNPKEMLFYIPVQDTSVATSGDYEQHFIHEGKRYSHNIDPLSGKPLSGIKSVTVFSPGAELSDALATAAYVMGVDKGIKFIDQLPMTHAIFIDENNNVHFSKDLNYES